MEIMCFTLAIINSGMLNEKSGGWFVANGRPHFFHRRGMGFFNFKKKFWTFWCLPKARKNELFLLFERRN